MKTFLIYIVIAISGGVEVKINTTIPPFYNLNECKEYVYIYIYMYFMYR